MQKQVVIDTIPSMMEALRLVWIISRHYNVDEKMIPLMERIIWELTERVTRVLHVRTLFTENSLSEIKKKTSEAKAMLELWKSSYFHVRAKIEASGRGVRWEFDRKRLFDRTDYLATICQDLYSAAEVLEEFHNIFCAEMISVTGNRERVEAILSKVNRLYDPIQQCSFDPYLSKNASDWRTLTRDFAREVVVIEVEAKRFIDEAFKKLRSAEGAFDMLVRFKHVKSRQAINNQMMKKFGDILMQYDRQVETMNGIFQDRRNDPPLYKNQPPAAGFIIWEKSLFHRMKRTMVRFKTMAEMIESEMGRAIQGKYLSIGMEMRTVSLQKHARWYAEANTSMPMLLKRNLLKPVRRKSTHVHGSSALPTTTEETPADVSAGPDKISEEPGGSPDPPGQSEVIKASGDNANSASSMSSEIQSMKSSFNKNRNNSTNYVLQRVAASNRNNSNVRGSSMDLHPNNRLPKLRQSMRRGSRLSTTRGTLDAYPLYKEPQFEVDFDQFIVEIITEAKYMERLGFAIPDSARGAALHEEIYLQNVTMMKQMITTYNNTLAMLTPSDVVALHEQVADLRKVIVPASKRMTWRNIGIQEFAAKCMIYIARFSSVVHSMQKNVADIQQRLNIIRNADLFRSCPHNVLGQPPECLEYFKCIRLYQSQEVLELLRIYKDIGYILLKIEGIIWDTSTGCCPKMKQYYQYWEKAVYQVVVDLVLNNLKAFNRSISGERCLFQLEALLVAPDLSIHPAAKEVGLITPPIDVGIINRT